MSIRLSPIDHLFTGRGGYPINFLFFFEGRLDPEKVRSALDEALVVFTPCKSVLAESDPSTFLFEANSKGASWDFQTISTEIPRDDLAGLGKYFSSARSLPNEPLTRVTLTHHKSGSCLGVSISHCVVDGYSYFLFLTAWVRILNGKAVPAPVLDRLKLVPKNVFHGPFDADTVFEKTGFSLVNENRPGDESNVEWLVHDFTKDDLDSLYKKASSEVAHRLSLNDVLSADLWKRFARDHQKPGEALTFSCAYDYRRTYPKIDGSYFGNAVRGAAFKLAYSDLLDLNHGELALKINAAVKSVSADSVEASLSCLEGLRLKMGLESMEKFHVANPRTGFLVTNLSRLPLLELDFGTGAPTDFKILTPARRTAVILPLSNGGLRVQTAL